MPPKRNWKRIFTHEVFRLGERETRIGIVGSNAKGSTAFYLAALCDPQRKKIGLFTSPHLLCIEERIRLRTQAEPLAQAVGSQLAWESLEELKKILERWKELPFGVKQESLSYFEMLTLLAAYVFRKEHCFLEIFEAGLGGAWMLPGL